MVMPGYFRLVTTWCSELVIHEQPATGIFKKGNIANLRANPFENVGIGKKLQPRMVGLSIGGNGGN